MKTNIYLDIDGVLLANDLQPTNHANEFLKFVLSKFTDSTYWLTTHCQGDANVPLKRIGHLFSEDVADMMKKIKPTKWGIAKTEAIDFSKPFLWFDDDLFYKEEQDLIKHKALDNWIKVDLVKDPDNLARFIRSFPLPIQPK